MLNFRDKPKEAVEASAKLLEDDDKGKEEMPIVEWLRRLNMDKYAYVFIKMNIYFVNDLRFYTEERTFQDVFK